jgi:hypothetical protein
MEQFLDRSIADPDAIGFGRVLAEICGSQAPLFDNHPKTQRRKSGRQLLLCRSY